ncbi:acyltransferase family protein [Agrobacterium tumefaciens]|uniref:acyltransferase family protein n=1 Tax=Agrobacterium tumefaciens TaxID=358 RepID=UPI001F418580|nr:acyltransferase [Agrobacterium tumefaciens]
MRDQRITNHLDGIRGLAAIIVIAGHASNFGMPIIPGVDLTATAKAGVWLFFMLSAYLLTDRLRNDLSSADAVNLLRAFILKRIFRIIPLYAIVLACAAWAGWLSWEDSFAHLFMADGKHHFWTIPVEMMFYALLPIILSVVRTRNGIYIFAAISLAISIAAGPGKIAENTLSFSPFLVFFAAGMALSVTPKINVSGPAATAICTLSLAMLVFVSPRFISWYFNSTINEALSAAYLHILPWAVVILFSGHSSLFFRLFSSSFMRFCGSISFALYLVHYPIMDAASGMGYSIYPAAGVALLMISGSLSWFLHRLIEIPFISIGKRIAGAARNNL